MKNIRIIPATLLLLGLLTGCSKDKAYFEEGGDEPGPSNGTVGYLDFSSFKLSVTDDLEQFPSTGDVKKTRATGATSEAPEDYQVTITNSKTSEVVFTGTYAQLKAKTAGGPMALAPDPYSIKAQSSNYAAIPAVAWESPAFSGSKNFTIIKNTTTDLSKNGGLVCTLGNIKTTVSLSADLDRLFKPDTGDQKLTTTLSLGASEIVFGRTEKRAAYFKAVEATNNVTVRLQGMYNKAGEGETPVYTSVDWRQEIPGCKAGQWRNITITVLNADKGNVQFQLTVETWVYDEKIDVNIANFYVPTEEVIPDEEVSDPDSPVMSLEGKNIEDVFKLNTSMFDFDVNTCSNMITAVASPKTGSTLEKLSIVFDSDNAAFLSALAAAGFADNTVELWPENTEASLRTYVVMRQSGNDLMAKVTFAGMKGLYDFPGTHTVKFIAKDSQKRTSYTQMTIQVTHGSSSDTGPAVVWRGGYDFDTRYPNLTTPVVIDVTSKTGITGFTVDIDSNVLTPWIMEEMGLATHMDLINPATAKMRQVLSEELGFPVGDQIQGKTTMEFDITGFMPMMSALGSGMCDFTINVTDASGTNSKTIKLTVMQP